jgi:membrane fusion protein, multidrug efflux system
MSGSNSSIPSPTQSAHKRTVLMLGIPLVAAVIGACFFFIGGNSVSTDNAYVKAAKVMVSSQEPGFVVQVNVRENQHVNAGDTLFLIDDARVKVSLAKAEAELAQARTSLYALKASYREKAAELELAEQSQAFAEREYARQAELARKKVVSSGSFDSVANQRDAARKKTEILRQEMARLLANLDGNAEKRVEEYPQYMTAEAERAKAALSVSNTKIVAPFSGIAGKAPQIGQYVAVGQSVMSVVSDTEVWVEANFKETELARIKSGQVVQVKVDAYPDQVLQARIDSISQASGSEFSVLPAQNATGNWVKVVQRIAVRIALDNSAQATALRAGMSANVEVDTHEPVVVKPVSVAQQQAVPPQNKLANAQH